MTNFLFWLLSVPYFFPLFVIGSYGLTTFILYRKGWADLAAQYKIDGSSFTGTRIGIISASINSANYNNCLVLQYNEEGIYLRPILLFRLFHDPILIPWDEIKEIRTRKILFFNYKELIIGDPLVATIKLKESIFNKIKEAAPMGFHKFD
jgi:hypothetical protein